ncbi:hypothetical protein [Peribacillus sp. SI8-4]|uniref:hypothetical protein n=1 Tax=Peribacillus sp. SI8-4 TaxID=3048009 RepID=UPI0025573333|nr:hypothetical protein [Peribacillus sp. SI8-4]
MMNKLGKMRFLMATVAFVLLIVQAVIGIMMFVDSDDAPMKNQAMAGQPADRDTGAADNSLNGGEAEGEGAATDSNDASGNIGTPPQARGDGSGTPGEMPNFGGFQRGSSLAGKYIDFYQGAGGLASSITLLLIGGAGIVTSLMARKTTA